MTQGTPPSVIHGWKATDLCYAMVKTKKDFLNPVSRQNFAYAFAVTHNLNLELCPTTYIYAPQLENTLKEPPLSQSLR